jgi:hypothetical protein
MRQINVGNYPGVPVRCPMERYDAAPASRTQATHLLTAGCVDYDRRELAVTVLLHCRDRPYAVSLRAMVPSWASGRPARAADQEGVGVPRRSDLNVHLLRDDRGLSVPATGLGQLCVRRAAGRATERALVALLAPLVSYRRRDVGLVLVPLWNLVVVWTIGSRIARLPHRDWPLRPDELDRQTTQRGPG